MVVALYWNFTELGWQYKGVLLYLGRTASYGNSIGKALFQKRHCIRMATYSGGNIFRWHCIGNTLDQSGTVSGWQRIWMILYMVGSEAKLNWIEMAPYRDGTGSKWHCIGLLLYRIGNVFGFFVYWGYTVLRWCYIGKALDQKGTLSDWCCIELATYLDDSVLRWYCIGKTLDKTGT